jgi:hypothetical protein
VSTTTLRRHVDNLLYFAARGNPPSERTLATIPPGIRDRVAGEAARLTADHAAGRRTTAGPLTNAKRAVLAACTEHGISPAMPVRPTVDPRPARRDHRPLTPRTPRQPRRRPARPHPADRLTCKEPTVSKPATDEPITRSLDDLVAAAAAGETITADELARAKADADAEHLNAQARAVIAEREAAAELEAARAAWREQYATELAAALADGRSAYLRFVETEPLIVRAVERVNTVINAGRARAHELGIGSELVDKPIRTAEILEAAHRDASGQHRLDGSTATHLDGPIIPQRLRRHPLHDPAWADRIDTRLAREAEARHARHRAHAAHLAAGPSPSTAEQR